MPCTCCVPGCKTTGKRIFHSYPKDESLCLQWIAITKCYHLCNQNAYKTHYKVCRKHFRKEDVKPSNKLHKGVIPTLALPISDDCLRVENDSLSGIEMNGFVEDAATDNIYEDVEMIDDNLMDLDVDADMANTEVVGMECAYVNINATKYEIQKDEIIALEISPVESADVNDGWEDVGGWYDAENYINDGGFRVNIVYETYDEDKHTPGDSNNDSLSSGHNSIPHQNQKDLKRPVLGRPVNSKAGSSRKYDPVKRKLKYQSSRIKFLTKKVKQLQKPNLNTVIKTLEPILNVDQMNFIKLQIRNAGKKNRGKRFNFEDKCMALAIYKQSPKCYRHMSEMFDFPSKQTLMKHSSKIRFEAGLSPNLMKFIKNTASKLNDLDKNVFLIWDEMALHPHLDFAEIKDYIDGFGDLGGKRSNNFATHGLVFMVRGINLAFKQPVAYFLTENISSGELKELIKLIVEAVLDTGLNVIGSVCDALSTNIAAINKLIKSGPRRPPGGRLLEYTIKDAKIIHLFDTPHLIKSVRNNLFSKDLEHYVMLDEQEYRTTLNIVWNEKATKKRSASWDHVRAFYKFDHNSLFRLAPKITDEHIDPNRRKMKVKIATQIFSGTFGKNMYFCCQRRKLEKECIGTSMVLLFFNDLFDSLNGSGVVKNGTLKGSINETSKHFHFWKYALLMLEKMKFGSNRKTGKPNRSNVMKHLMSTLKGVIKLCRYLFQLNVPIISLRQTNQDPLENFFGLIRSYCGSSVKPSPRQFRCAYATAIVNNLSSKQSINANCEDDESKSFLSNIHNLFAIENDSDDTDGEMEVEDLSNFDNVILSFRKLNFRKLNFRKLNFTENEAQNNISGAICKKILAKIKCTACKTAIESRGSSGPNMTVLPSTELIDTIKTLISKIEQMLPVVCFHPCTA